MNPVHYLVYLFPIATLLALFAFFYWYWGTQRAPLAKRLITPPEEAPREQPRFTFAGRCHPLVRRDAIPILLITAVYAVTAFAHLGSLRAPQSAWDFGSGESATFSLPEAVQVSQLWYYPNLGTGKYQVEISEDGVTWLTLWSRTETDDAGSEETVYYWADSTGYGESFAMTQNYNQLFKWNEIVFENHQYIRYLRITGQANKGLLELGELLRTPARQLSLGQRMRCEIAAALLHEPKILFLDEPTIGLDAVSKAAVRGFIRICNKERGTTVILTTHDMQDIEALAERILLIGRGRILLDGTLDELKRRRPAQRRLTVAYGGGALPAVEGLTPLRDTGLLSVSEAVARISAQTEVKDLSVSGESVEELVVSLYREYRI